MDLERRRVTGEPVVRVEIDTLSAGESPRSGGESEEHIEVLAGAREELPPILVHRTTRRVIDGAHRVRVARLRGQRTIAVRFFDGSEADAFVLGVKANIAHGLPLSLSDRKRAAERVVVSHPLWSDRMVASATGIAAGTVAEIRKRTPGSPARARIGQDGRLHPVDGTEGRRAASALITENPGLSLRRIAQLAGISPETARDVRNRLNRGEDPIPRQRTGGRPQPRPATGIEDHAAVVERLKADPALRFNETGRSLLTLLNLHTIRPEDWETIIGHVPPHVSRIVAGLARDCAERWKEFAAKVEDQVPAAG
ncbi:streptomycin biosynthesis protein [Amycolatopsis pittospori]|uniref:streptomycin biosynthesis protein n=1 Tax=Amycolatopsis pittospori TaxID=2749434 RepID=UPI002E2C6D2D|nr:streptomycin biosynthesis protein [Amycolatopsis pittospori]